ncbi:hypothetical protein BdWA1_002185 [Babesia duncani]|uniref:Uncharacterized protein n=1 Tax=Babesia duncani TaxID=323732 RepID=A0AAD9PL86_9APIC|nr:hypothetical protein BdWA1_002185 [Babesia duncani]
MASRVDYEILKEDQDRIVKFSTLYNAKLKTEKQYELLKDHLSSIRDAQDEILINLDTPLLKIGKNFEVAIV